MQDQVTHRYELEPIPHIYIKWEFMIYEQLFRDGMNKLIDMMKKHKTGRVLSNVVELGALTENDQKWSVNDWLPRALAAGYSAIAVVISEELFGKMAVEDVLNDAAEKSPIQIQYFDNEDIAAEWLASL